MTVTLIVVALLVALAGAVVLARQRIAARPTPVHRILLPFTGLAISRRALDGALRLANAEDATLMPAYLAVVPRQLPLDSPLPKEASGAMPLLEAIEQRAAAQHVPVDARIQRGRTYRHALLRLLDQESFDRVVVPATALPRVGFSGSDLVWLLEEAPAEVVILRPGPEDTRVVSGNTVGGAPDGCASRAAPSARSRASSPTPELPQEKMRHEEEDRLEKR